MKQYRHGDIWLETSKLPVGAKKVKTNILAEGEVTGHAHAVKAPAKDFEVYEHDGTLYLNVVAPSVPLEHEEHKTIAVPQGIYEVRRQREYDPLEKVVRDAQD